MSQEEPESKKDKDSSAEEPSWPYIVYLILIIVALFGLIYNYLQVEKSSIFSAYLVDVVAVSYTNLLAYPLLAFVFFLRIKKTKFFDTDTRSFIGWSFLTAPFILVGSALIFRVLGRLLQTLWAA